MVANGIVPEGPTEIQQALTHGLGLPPKFKVGDLSWVPSFNRLELRAEGEGIDLGAVAGQIISLLPHTPLTAIGNNFHLEREAGCYSVGVDGDLARALPQGTAFSFVVRVPLGDGGVARVEIDEDTPRLAKVNVHRAANGIEEARSAAGLWRADEERVPGLLQPFERAEV
jgi:hypothetical protein